VAFEIARRHRFAADMARLPDDVVVHVLPTGRRGAGGAEGAALPRRAPGRASGWSGRTRRPRRTWRRREASRCRRRGLRRPLSLLVVVGLAFAATLLPLLVLLAIGLSVVVPGPLAGAAAAAFALVYLLLECVGLAIASCCGWRAASAGSCGSPVFQRAHYAVLHGLLKEVLLTARVLFHLEIVDEDVSWSPLDDGVPGSTERDGRAQPARRAGRLAADGAGR
jgi:hypothetical protein